LYRGDDFDNPSSLRAQKGAEEEKFTHSFTTTENSERLQVIKPLILKQAQTHFPPLPQQTNKEFESKVSLFISLVGTFSLKNLICFFSQMAQVPRGLPIVSYHILPVQ
jgi:hypothetical protein